MSDNFGAFLKDWTPPVLTEQPKPEPKTIKEGDILVAQWGYEANNVNYFKVLKRTKSFIEFAELQGQKQPGDTGIYMGSYVVPSDTYKGWSVWAKDPNARSEDGAPIVIKRKVVIGYNGDECVKLEYYATAHIWDGNPQVDYNHH